MSTVRRYNTGQERSRSIKCIQLYCNTTVIITVADRRDDAAGTGTTSAELVAEATCSRQPVCMAPTQATQICRSGCK